MKNLITLFFLLTAAVSFAQDTIIIENEDFTLQVRAVPQATKPFYNRTISVKQTVKHFHFVGSLGNLIEQWIAAAAFEEIEYKIDGSRYNARLINFEDSTLVFNKKFDVVMTIKETENPDVDFSQIQKAAFETFLSLTEVELNKQKTVKTFWELSLVDENTSAISIDQNKFWNRSDLENYVYYERIHIKRIADLLSRKLDSFVRPVTSNFLKFDIKMPYSDDFFDLKYAMIEHGFELTEVTKEIEVWIIKI